MQIQRIQTIFLLLAAITTGVYLYSPVILFDYGTTTGNVRAFQTNQWIIGYFVYVVDIAAGIAAGGALVAIALFKFPAFQKAFCVLGIAGMLFCFFFVLYQWYTMEYRFDTLFYYGNITPWVVIILFVLALRGIIKDEQLLKSYDRMR